MSLSLRIGVLYGFRNPAASGLSFPEMYARVLQQIELVDQLGFDHVWITEHHFVDDGYMPSPLVISGAIAARTTRVAIGQDVMLLPFTHPVRLAEDLAVLDNLSNGRMMIGAGMGYVPSEFAAMGIPRAQRRARMDETLEIVRRAFTEDRFDFDGTHYRLRDVRVRPRPVQPGGPPLFVAAMGEPGARRAARFDAHLLPQGDRRAVLDPWRADLTARGRDASDYRIGIARPLVVSDDPNAAAVSSDGVALAKVAAGGAIPHESMRVYDTWMRELSANDRMKTQLIEGDHDGTLIPQDAFVGTADACVTEALRMHHEFGVTDIIVPGFTGSQPADRVDANLTRLAREVLPVLRAAAR
jgi:alkanesulfonate monooxygenase SsuD/methylene tetrahydromethanopterin reductase-like flavin-dependent oxidoreductase (luciferase family)